MKRWRPSQIIDLGALTSELGTPSWSKRSLPISTEIDKSGQNFEKYCRHAKQSFLIYTIRIGCNVLSLPKLTNPGKIEWPVNGNRIYK